MSKPIAPSISAIADLQKDVADLKECLAYLTEAVQDIAEKVGYSQKKPPQGKAHG